MANSLMERLATPQVAPPWTLGDVLLTLLALAIGQFVIGATMALLLFPNQVASAGAISISGVLFGWNMGWVVVLLYTMIVRRRTTEQWQALALNTPATLPLSLVVLFAVGVILLIDVIAAGGAGSFSPTAALIGVGRGGLVEWAFAAVLLLILQPITESLVFMGVILPRLRASLSPYAGILLTAGLYAAVHFLLYGAALSGSAVFWYGIFAPFGAGLFLACVRVYTASTRAVVVAAVGMGLTLLLVALVLAG